MLLVLFTCARPTHQREKAGTYVFPLSWKQKQWALCREYLQDDPNCCGGIPGWSQSNLGSCALDALGGVKAASLFLPLFKSATSTEDGPVKDWRCKHTIQPF
jgi:hypothetical protein